MNGIVTNVADPLGKSRIRFYCPVVLGLLESEWASPAVAGGPSPAVGGAIYAAFVDGDITRPIWFGGEAAAYQGTSGRITVVNGVVNIDSAYVASIEQGGTGGVTAQEARDNLEVFSRKFYGFAGNNAGNVSVLTHNLDNASPVVVVKDSDTKEALYGATVKYLDANSISVSVDVDTDFSVTVYG